MVKKSSGKRRVNVKLKGLSDDIIITEEKMSKNLVRYMETEINETTTLLQLEYKIIKRRILEHKQYNKIARDEQNEKPCIKSFKKTPKSEKNGQDVLQALYY